MNDFLKPSKYIDSDHPEVITRALELSCGIEDPVEIARNCFEFVRDEIKHSGDFQQNPVTCIASDVLRFGTGYCYAKSHLLAALLRANGIATGLCYQRLTIADDAPPFCLHGLNAIYLESSGWYRVDARGNKPGVNAQFCPPAERLAFPLRTEGETDFQYIWVEPLPEVVSVLEKYDDYLQVLNNLPDMSSMRPTTEQVSITINDIE
tara:strand:- start:50 stop:670 length:621 start_codon:yes stop_codon:yes gene_type:complete